MEWGEKKPEKLHRDNKEIMENRKELKWRTRNTQEEVNDELSWGIAMVKKKYKLIFVAFLNPHTLVSLVYLLAVIGRNSELWD